MSTELTAEQAREICGRFALKHRVIFDDRGECGFGRECVGFSSGDKWIDHNPCTMGGNYDRIESLACKDTHPPEDVDAYHKHHCLAVLGRGDGAIIGLAKWVLKMEAAGEVEVVSYETGATGFQALVSGVHARAVVVRKKGGAT